MAMPMVNHLQKVPSFSVWMNVIQALIPTAERPPFITMPMSSQNEQRALSLLGQHLKY